jgi:ATP-dependent helicase/nuclease subunit A
MVSYEKLTDEQQAAVNTLDRNVALTAGAGTGKTTTLTARYVRMFEAALADADSTTGADAPPLLPENILTTTFTERAANELEASIRAEITDRIASLDVDEFEAWRTIADELEDGYIHTLHGFCSRLLREHALTIDAVDPGFDALDETETNALINDTVTTVLEEYETHEATQTLARRFSRSQLHDILCDLLSERPESLEWAARWCDASQAEYLDYVKSELHPIDAEEAAARLADDEFVAAATTLTRLVKNPPHISTEGTKWERAVGVVELLEDGYNDGVPSASKQTLVAALGTHLTTGKGERYAGYTGAKKHWDGHPEKDTFDNAFTTLVEALCPEDFVVSVDLDLEANSWPFVHALAKLTKVAAAEYESRKDQQNVVDFTDQITYAVEFLSDDANAHIRDELCDQFAYVMVDEFQDTDPRQWDLVKLLTASDRETFDAENVFVVGDIKQSIYRFRNADVTVFRDTAETLTSNEDDDAAEIETDGSDETGGDQLSTNFRTLPVVLETINELFETVFDEEGEPYEAAPQSLTPHRDDHAGVGSVEYLAVPTDDTYRQQRFDYFPKFATATPEHDAELEAMALASRLSQFLADPVEVYPEPDEEIDDTADNDDESPPTPRAVEPSDIAVLIRSRTHLKQYERAFEDVDIPYSVASGIGFYDTPEITALVNLLRALADPSDERALYAMLRSPLFGLTDDTLARLKLHDEPLWDALAETDTDELTTVYETLQDWRQLAGLGADGVAGFDGSWAAYLTRIIDDTGYLVSVSGDERPQQARANVEKFREQLRGWSDDGVRSLSALVSQIERRIDIENRESEADTTGDGVQVLTIHDAKGLEFPVVAVPGLSREFNNEAALGSRQVEFEKIGDEYAVGMKAPSPDDAFDLQDTLARQTIRDQRRAEERAEEKRVLYVACTRARDHLLLSGTHSLDDADGDQTFTNIETADPGDASSWRDWVQPELLPDEIKAVLDSDRRVERTYGDGIYTVSLPTPPVTQPDSDPDPTPTVELSPTPPAPDLTFRISATDLAALLGGYGELERNEETRTISVVDPDTVDRENPDTRHGDESQRNQVDNPEVESTTTEEISPTVFGELVHRICELHPPTEQWGSLMEQTLVDQDANVSVTDELHQRVRTHAERGIKYVESQTADGDDEHQYDELYVTANFDHGEISGYIDHLIVTPSTYRIIDYKTGHVTSDEIEDDTDYYANQLKAYAVALHQQNTGRSVQASLVFTDADEVWETEWSPAEIDAFEQMIRDHVYSSKAWVKK